MKILKATLKETLKAAVNIDMVDFDVDVLMSTSAMNKAKSDLLKKIRQEMYDKIATLDMDDIKYEITNY